MSSTPAPQDPVDTVSRDRLAAGGLRLDRVDTTDAAAFAEWIEVEARGFHDPSPARDNLTVQLADLADRRTTAVFDGPTPVATVSSWVTGLTVPGGSIDGWAISAVTVAPTHRRRGIARAMLESELRDAHTRDVPVAMLTVTDARLYGRYGFGPAARQTTLTIDPARASWIGPVPGGSLTFRSAEQLLEEGPPIKARAAAPGEIVEWHGWWRRLLGLALDDDARRRSIRSVRYDDVDGVAQGFATYRVIWSDGRATLQVEYLCTVTVDAYAALWRFLLEQDLVTTVEARLRPVAEPLEWMVADARAVTRSHERDHEWLRILDPVATLRSRTYSRAGMYGFVLHDPLGFADGTVVLEVADDGTARAERVETAPDGAATIELGIAALSAISLGGTDPVALAAAGRLRERTHGAADAIATAFRSPVVPWLSLWY